MSCDDDASTPPRLAARGRAAATQELQFLGTGGGWVLLVSVAASVGLLAWLIGAPGVGGGGLLPLSEASQHSGATPRTGGATSAPDSSGPPTRSPGRSRCSARSRSGRRRSPSCCVWLLALPAAAMGAWFAASRLTERGSVRAVAALVWAFAPPFLIALGDGRPGAVLAHVLLGWLAFAAFGAATSWAAAATASLLFAAVIAAAPSLAPALIVAWVVAMAVSGRAWGRLAMLPIPALALALPLIIDQIGRGNPIALARRPRPPGRQRGAEHLATRARLPRRLAGAAGTPSSPACRTSTSGWRSARSSCPSCSLAIAAVIAPRIRSAVLALGAALLGFATAVGASHLAVATVGPAEIALWTGAGLSLAWLGLVLAAVVALDARATRSRVARVRGLRRCARRRAADRDRHRHRPGRDRPGRRAHACPRSSAAEAENDSRVTTMRLTPDADGSLRATLERGRGVTLDEQSTLADTAETLSAAEEQLAEIAGNLASRSGFDPDAAIREFGVSFVLLDAPLRRRRARSGRDGRAGAHRARRQRRAHRRSARPISACSGDSSTPRRMPRRRRSPRAPAAGRRC